MDYLFLYAMYRSTAIHKTLCTGLVYRFDPEEPITHGVETLNHCEINVDVAVTGNDSWALQTEEEAHAKMGCKNVLLDFSVVVENKFKTGTSWNQQWSSLRDSKLLQSLLDIM